jgi:L-threonylcarbamoyladenylate synthase
LDVAVNALKKGEIAAYPTETVYGLGVDPFSEEAVRRLFAVKRRASTKPVLLIVASREQLEEITSDISPKAEAYMSSFWPGPVSFLLPKAARLPALVTAGADKVCVRWPACAIALSLCGAWDRAITSSSANISGASPARSIADIDLPGVTVGVDGGVLPPSLPSTIFDPDRGLVLREGAVSSDALRSVSLPA